MNCIQLCQEVRSLGGKRVRIQPLEKVFFGQTIKSLLQLPFNILGITEGIAALRDTNTPRLTRPFVDIMDKMPMDCTIVLIIQFACRQRLG